MTLNILNQSMFRTQEHQCQREDGTIDYSCYEAYASNGQATGVVHPPGQGSIPDSWSLEQPMKSQNVPQGASVNPPGTGSVDGWSYELPMSNAPTDGSFSGGGGSSGGGGATGSY
jgi:uncharacterized membrane protein YgcG